MIAQKNIGPLLTFGFGPAIELERLTTIEGYFAVGFLAYEAAAAFGYSTCDERTCLPLAWFACLPRERCVRNPLARNRGEYVLGPPRASWSLQDFERAFHVVKNHLADGNSYQVNLTFRMKGIFSGDSAALFADLVENQQAGGALYIKTRSWTVCSASPEIFFSLEDSRIVARPMKGTAARGRSIGEDRIRCEELRTSVKRQAENVMVVDMIRNDLGRIAEWGSVEVPELFTVERYPTMWQMTLHPSASITDAPKRRSMEILSELEPGPRGLYCGAVGYVTPQGTARFNVAIRTAVIDHGSETLDFGVGCGIVWDSDPRQEYAECLLKARVLERPVPRFDLLETMRWSRHDGYVLLDRHLSRLAGSAAYFGYAFDNARTRAALAKLASELAPLPGDRRVRLLVGRDGGVTLEHTQLESSGRELSLGTAASPVDASDVFLFHKTTRRDVYNRARMDGFDDVVLWNERAEITETTTCNIVVETERGLVTPPVACGLLAGTLREEALDRREIREEVVSLETLRRIGWCWVVSSVHGWRRARVESR